MRAVRNKWVLPAERTRKLVDDARLHGRVLCAARVQGAQPAAAAPPSEPLATFLAQPTAGAAAAAAEPATKPLAAAQPAAAAYAKRAAEPAATAERAAAGATANTATRSVCVAALRPRRRCGRL